jgi:hypothetical protein
MDPNHFAGPSNQRAWRFGSGPQTGFHLFHIKIGIFAKFTLTWLTSLVIGYLYICNVNA